MQNLLYLLLILFIVALGFAPAKEIGDKVKSAARFATFAVALGAVAWLIYVRTIG